MKSYSDFFSLLSDETRLRCLVLLSTEPELCVCDLCQTLDCIQPKVSRHLSLLRNSHLVTDERRGQWVYYQLNKDLEIPFKTLLHEIITNLQKAEPFASDRKKLKTVLKSRCC